jgi:hypothetical protein
MLYAISNSLLAFLLGCLVGLAELLSRYSNPYRILDKKFANWYIVVNGTISILGFWVLKKMQKNLENSEIELENVLISGLAAMVVLRSSIASINHQGKKIEIGIGGLLQVYLDAIEKLFNRKRSEETLNDIYAIMKDVDFETAKINLPSICLSTFQNLPEEQAKQLGSKIKTLSDKGLDHMKSVELGVILEHYFGEGLLRAAVEILKKQQAEAPAQTSLNEIIKNFK